MKKWKDTDRLLRISVVCYFVTAITVFFLPLTAGFDKGNNVIRNIIGFVFWMGIISGTLIFGWVWSLIKEKKEYMVIKQKYKPAFKSFFTKPVTIISDSIFCVALLLIILGNTALKFNDAIQLLLMFVVLFTFFMHFILGGRVYRYIIMNKERKEKRRE